MISWNSLSSPGTRWGQKKHWVRCLKPLSPKPHSARFRLSIPPYTQNTVLRQRVVCNIWMASACASNCENHPLTNYPLDNAWFIKKNWNQTPLLVAPIELHTRSGMRSTGKKKSYTSTMSPEKIWKKSPERMILHIFQEVLWAAADFFPKVMPVSVFRRVSRFKVPLAPKSLFTHTFCFGQELRNK